MDDPWNVKTVRDSGQYVSCLKISGVPLLPPVLSRECRKEMQYYKLLAKEVENRISVLKSYFYNGEESGDEKSEKDLSICEDRVEIPENVLKAGFGINIDKITAIASKNDNYSSDSVITTQVNTACPTAANLNITSNVVVKTSSSLINPPKLFIDLSLCINDTGKHILESLQKPSLNKIMETVELPEHDYEYKKPERPNPKPVCKKQKELILEMDESYPAKKCQKPSPENLKDSSKQNCSSECSFHSSMESIKSDEVSFVKNTKPSCSGSTFVESNVDTDNGERKQPPLARQQSYTLLKPSPQLLAHLKNETSSTGLEMSAISMNEPVSKSNSPNKKRRNWDLETAKVKWSSMALELEHANVNKTKPSRVRSPELERPNSHVAQKPKGKCFSRQRSRSVTVENHALRSPPNNKSPNNKSNRKESANIPCHNIPSNVTIVKEPIAKSDGKQRSPSPPKRSPPVVQQDNVGGVNVAELYKKIQKQQLSQITNLIEQQKTEKMILQQVFEQRSSCNFKPVSPPSPKSSCKKIVRDPVECSVERGPVSLNEVINDHYDDTIAQTNDCISRCELIMKKGNDIKSTIKKHIAVSQRAANREIQLEGSRTRTNSPRVRKLTYDSTSDYDHALTDRTNDTMADLQNITFTSDSESSPPLSSRASSLLSRALSHNNSLSKGQNKTDSAIKNLEHSIHNSMKSMNKALSNNNNVNDKTRQPTKEEREAATTIVAHVKGYLIRRLMRCGKVQATVATIREALECALDLHRDRDGIRGADVTLHRRLIKQITAACYSLHEIFITSTPAERCAMIAADRARLQALASKASPVPRARHTPRSRKSDVMSKSHSGSFPTRAKRVHPASVMTQSSYESHSNGRSKCTPRYVPSPRHRASRPWR